MLYCEFEDTNQLFNNKKVYKCKYCGTTLALENPEANIMCFKRQNDFLDQLDNQERDTHNQIMHQQLSSVNQTKDAIKADMMQKALSMPPNPDENRPENMCSKEEIDARLSICQQCEYYKNDSCMLCGCVILREKNYNNKLAHKDKSCPINKWGPITS